LADRECKNLASELDLLDTLRGLDTGSCVAEDASKIKEISEDLLSIYDD
jgi:hypothetical protein